MVGTQGYDDLCEELAHKKGSTGVYNFSKSETCLFIGGEDFNLTNCERIVSETQHGGVQAGVFFEIEKTCNSRRVMLSCAFCNSERQHHHCIRRFMHRRGGALYAHAPPIFKFLFSLNHVLLV
ncbi:hypothetical protein Fot_38123 [Forsythia ovata]|uniref:Uncharacterized protein n=1 Tax=Forsythia ovata TaxID=205694 RepID=A0ABD1S0X5_9LAMI